MNKDFILITGHGIFPTASILQIVPVTDVSFDITVTPPADEDSKFIFSVTKNVSVNVEIARSNPKKKNEVETLTDYGYSQDTAEQYDFEQNEFLELIGLSDDDDVKSYIKDYIRRLKKNQDYEKAVTAIESNPDLPDYEASLAAVKHNAPGSSYTRKQEKTLTKLYDVSLEKFLGIIEAASDDSDAETDKIIGIINSAESQDSVELAANKALKAFYSKNLGFVDDDEDDFEEDSDSDNDSFLLDEPDNLRVLEMADQALERADVIRTTPSENRITNSLTEDKDEDETEN